jgi:predicted DsbA family dithiol-disulfide isomerase
MNPSNPVPMKIDFVSDVSCPWCVIGLRSLEQALERVGPQVKAQLHFQPFELNPDMAAEGQDIDEHISQKYGSTPEQMAQTREHIRARGAELGFVFGPGKRSRIYNTFDAHRLLHWAGLQDQAAIAGAASPDSQLAQRQLALKEALFSAYFTDGESPGSHEVLLRVAEQVGLDSAGAKAVLESDQFAIDVRRAERFYQSQGIRGVPAIIINERHLISGGQPPEVFEQALRQIAAL